MKNKNNTLYGGSRMVWLVGAAILGYGLYRILKSTSRREDIDLEPAASPSEAHPYFDPKPHRHQDAYIPKNQESDHRTHVGNAPGERNQIGGRATGKTARY